MILTTAAATCLAMNVYFEARNQDVDGQKLVAEVTMTRAALPGFPDNVCDVVWQRGAFSWTADGRSDHPRDAKAWRQAQIVASDALIGGCDLCIGATHYATVDADPYWADSMEIVGTWGDHIFYRNNGSDSAARVAK